MFNNKAISPVIASSLLIVVAVVAIVFFQEWFNEYESGIFINVEQRDIGYDLGVYGIIGDQLYLYSGRDQILNYFGIEDFSGAEMCSFRNGDEANFQGDTRLLLHFDSLAVNSTHAIDFSGYDNDGQKYGDVDCSNNFCKFDGDGDFINTISSPYLNFQNKSFTYSIWVFGGSASDYRVHTGLPSGSWEKFGFGTSSKYIFHFTNNTGPDNSFYCGDVLNEWTNLVVVGNYEKNNVSCYRNGIYNNSIEYTKGIIHGSNPVSFSIGGNSYSFDFNGSIDNVEVFSKLLSPKEIKLLYNSRKSLMYEQIIPKGKKQINVSSCDLTRGQVYDVIMFTDKSKYEGKVIVR